MPDILELLIEHWERQAAHWKAEAQAKNCPQCKVAEEAYEAVIADAREALRTPELVREKVIADRNGAQLESTMTLTRT